MTPPTGARPGILAGPGPQRSDRTVRCSVRTPTRPLGLSVLAGASGEEIDISTLAFLTARAEVQEEAAKIKAARRAHDPLEGGLHSRAERKLVLFQAGHVKSWVRGDQQEEEEEKEASSARHAFSCSRCSHRDFWTSSLRLLFMRQSTVRLSLYLAVTCSVPLLLEEYIFWFSGRRLQLGFVRAPRIWQTLVQCSPRLWYSKIGVSWR